MGGEPPGLILGAVDMGLGSTRILGGLGGGGGGASGSPITTFPNILINPSIKVRRTFGFFAAAAAAAAEEEVKAKASDAQLPPNANKCNKCGGFHEVRRKERDMCDVM